MTINESSTGVICDNCGKEEQFQDSHALRWLNVTMDYKEDDGLWAFKEWDFCSWYCAGEYAA